MCPHIYWMSSFILRDPRLEELSWVHSQAKCIWHSNSLWLYKSFKHFPFCNACFICNHKSEGSHHPVYNVLFLKSSLSFLFLFFFFNREFKTNKQTNSSIIVRSDFGSYHQLWEPDTSILFKACCYFLHLPMYIRMKIQHDKIIFLICRMHKYD